MCVCFFRQEEQKKCIKNRSDSRSWRTTTGLFGERNRTRVSLQELESRTNSIFDSQVCVCVTNKRRDRTMEYPCNHHSVCSENLWRASVNSVCVSPPPLSLSSVVSASLLLHSFQFLVTDTKCSPSIIPWVLFF